MHARIVFAGILVGLVGGCSAASPHDGSTSGPDVTPSDAIPADDTASDIVVPSPDAADESDAAAPPDDSPTLADVPTITDAPTFDGASPPLGPLQVLPANDVLSLGAGASTSVTYRVLDALGDDVTASSTLTIDDAPLGSFTGAVFTTSTTRGGISHVHAAMGALAGDTSVEVDRASDSIVLPGAPAGAPSLFGGTLSASRAPSFVYPDDHTIAPPNLPAFEVHVSPRRGKHGVRSHVQRARAHAGRVRTVHCRRRWLHHHARRADVHRSRDRCARAGHGHDGTARHVERRRYVRSGTESHARHHADARERRNLLLGRIERFDPSLGFRHRRRDARVVRRRIPIFCVGCHVLSRDGTRVALGHFIPSPANTQISDVASLATIGASFGSNFETFSPDDTRLLTSDGAHLTLLDATTGVATSGLAAGMVGSMPDWSADGTRAVFSRPSSVPPFGGTPGQTGAADLLVMAYCSRRVRCTDDASALCGRRQLLPELLTRWRLGAFQPLARRLLQQHRRTSVGRRFGGRQHTDRVGHRGRQRRSRQLVAEVGALRANVPRAAAHVAHRFEPTPTTACDCSSSRPRRTVASRSSGWLRFVRISRPAIRRRPRSGCPSKTSPRAITSRNGPRSCVETAAAPRRIVRRARAARTARASARRCDATPPLDRCGVHP